MPKQRTLKRIDSEPKQHVGGGEIITSAETIAPPIPAAIPEPRNLTATQGPIAQSAVTPSAYIDLEWEPPITALDGLRYIIEYDTSSAFTAPQRQTTANLTARLMLPTRSASGITYYFRIAALYNSYQQSDWSDTASATTVSDTAAPSAPTSPTAAYIGVGDLRIRWTKSTSDNLRDTLINIYDDATKTTLRETVYVDGEQFVWTVAQNRNRTSNVPRTSVYVELQSRSWGGTLSTAVNVSAASTAPSAPTVSVDFTGRDAIYTLSYGADVASLTYTPDTGVSARVIAPTTRYVYAYANNATDHSGTADPVLSYSFTATNGLNQSSTATSGTATNTAPSAPSSVTINGYLGTLSGSITATQPSDFQAFRVRIIQTSPSAADVTLDTYSTLITQSIDTPASYRIGVRVVDMFNQTSAETLSSTIAVDALTIAQLRADTIYDDGGEHTTVALNVLKDGNLSSGGVVYTGSNAQHLIKASRPFRDRYETITVAYLATAAVGMYIGLSTDDVNYTWYATTNPLTVRSSMADAQANAFIGGSGAQIYRLDLPSIVEARFIQIGMFSANSFSVYEFYPRRLVQSDDIEAESIKAINIAAGAVTAAKISVAQLSAITADMGSLTAGTITGATVQTAASGARVVLNSSGMTTYNSSGTAQVTATTGTDGALTAGGGAVTVDSSGISINAGTTTSPSVSNKITLKYSTREVGYLSSASIAGVAEHQVQLQSNGATYTLTGDNYASGGRINLYATGASGSFTDAQIIMRGGGTVGSSPIVDPAYININAASVNINAANLNLNATTAYGVGGNGTIGTNTSSTLNIRGLTAMHGASINAGIAQNVMGIGTTSSTRTARFTDTSGNINFDVYDHGRIATRSGVPWDLKGWTAGMALTSTGWVSVEVNGVTYRLLATI